jgi:hypothetical protein
MSDTERVRARRQRRKDGGLVPMTIWVKAATKARYEALALQSHRSGAELAQLALEAYRPEPVAVTAAVTEAEQLRTLIRDELDQAMAIMTTTVTATVTETLTAALPAVVQAALPVVGSHPATAPHTATPRLPPGRRKLTRRQAAALRAKRASGAPIKALMQDYGLSKATVHRYLKRPPPVQRPRPRQAAPVA